MPPEKATGLIVHTTDWSDTSRIATIWTRELGKVRVLAKGGRRLKSAFENALDLLSLVAIVLLRKSTGGLDLLTEAQVVRRFPRLATDLKALYAGYYVAELLADATQDYDPHPTLFDEAIQTLDDLGTPPAVGDLVVGRLARFELVMLRELGYSPQWDACAVCHTTAGPFPSFGAAAGGVLCAGCQARERDRRPISAAACDALAGLAESGDAWRRPMTAALRRELRQVLGGYVTYLMGRRPRLLPYLQGS